MDASTRMKDAMKWMWSLGDYRELAERLEPHAEALAAACGIRPASEVLDVAAGNGNFAAAAARRGARVTACDLTPRMVALGRERSQAEGLAIQWLEADAEDLPFPDDRFEVVASVFGAMFTPQPERVAAELFRVARPGGRVAMANYADSGFLGRISELLAGYAPPRPAEMASPFAWGDPTRSAAGSRGGRRRSRWRSGPSRSSSTRPRRGGRSGSGPTPRRSRCGPCCRRRPTRSCRHGARA